MGIEYPASTGIAEALAAAIQHHQAGYLDQAEQIYRQILQQQPNQVDALNLLGVIACQRGRLEEGIVLYRQALSVQPNHMQASDNLSLAIWKQGKKLIDEAIAYHRRAVNLTPNNPDTHFNLATILRERGETDEALTAYLNALALRPNDSRTLLSVGTLLQQRGKVDAAITYYQKAIANQPNYGDAYNNLGLALQEQGQVDAAMASYDRAVTLNPNNAEAHHNRACMVLAFGDLRQGFEEYEWRFKTDHFTPCPFPQPVWDGSDLTGKTIVLHGEQGLGDTLQFIRYVPLVARFGGQIVVVCQDPLLRLLSTLPEISQLVPWGKPLPEFQVYAPLLSLPRILGTTLETIPAQVPYLGIPQPTAIQLPPTPKPSLKVGLVWAGNHQHKKDFLRSCPLSHLQPLLTVPHVTYYSLQKGIPQLDLAQLGWQHQIHDLSNQLKDFADTAAAIAQLDLVITVDTAVAHLAGALGKPVWLMLSYMPDWRWLLDRTDSPWYPTMRLFRQPKLDDWQGAISQVVEVLTTTAAALSPGHSINKS